MDIIESLHPLEVEVLKHLSSDFSSLSEISERSGLKDIEVLRALGWLEKKGLVELREKKEVYAFLGENGRKYLEEGLPEKRLYEILLKQREVSFKDLPSFGFSKDEISASIGALKERGVIEVDNGVIRLKSEISSFPEEDLLRKIAEGVSLEDLSHDEIRLLDKLKKRKDFIKIETKTVYYAKLTKKGLEVAEKASKVDVINALTRDLIISGEWKNKKLRRYDLRISPGVYPYGKRNVYLMFFEMIKRKLVGLGFEEERGPFVLNNFWNMDALFVPHDHPSREIHDTFYLKLDKSLEVPRELFERVKREHLKYWKVWNDSFSLKPVLRSQATAISALTMAKKVKVPGRYFTISKVFRPDEIDAKHFIEFYQLDGIVVDEDISFRDLLSIIVDLTKEIAQVDKVKLYPGYFPFTEPSVEIYAKHPTIGWMEVGGAGLFREEVTRPLGIEVPVIAWGLGIDRLAIIALDIDDIRKLHTYDIEWLKNKPYKLI